MTDIPVERRTYLPLVVPPAAERRDCPSCGRPGLAPWNLRRDRQRRVFRRWVCVLCQAYHDVPEDESA